MTFTSLLEKAELENDPYTANLNDIENTDKDDPGYSYLNDRKMQLKLLGLILCQNREKFEMKIS